MKIACTLLLVWFGVHYGYEWAPLAKQGTVFNIARSAGSLVLLALVVLATPTRLVLLVAAGVAAEELQVVVCGIWWLVEPWPLKPGDELCSAALGLPLGTVGLMLLGMVAGHLLGKNNAQ